MDYTIFFFIIEEVNKFYRNFFNLFTILSGENEEFIVTK